MNEKTQKKQGPIRKGAAIPFFVFVTLVSLFNVFLLDSTIKSSIEIIGGKVNGAEVNVGSVKTSLTNLKLDIKNIQFTDKEDPIINSFSIGKISTKLLWDALLRGKLVVDLAAISDIKIKSKRSYAGKIYPVEVNDKGESEQEVKTKKALKKIEKGFEGNVFGDIAGVLAGGSTGDVTANMATELESKKKFEALSAKIKKKEAELTKQFKSLPDKKELSRLKSKFNKIKWKNLGNITKAPGILKEADKLNKDLNKAMKSYKKLNKNFNKSLKEIDNDYKEAEKLIGKDISSVKKRMNLPTLDQSAIAKSLFGQEVLDKINKAREYQKVAAKYMPPKKEKELVSAVPRKSGKDYQFGKPNSYPMFWLKLAQINSKNEQGTVIGKIENITSNQRAIGKLTTAQMKADFPVEEIRNIDVKLEVDHRESAKAKVRGSIGSMKIKDKAISNSSDAKFIIADSSVRTHFNGEFDTEKASLKLDNNFEKITYKVESKNEAMREVLQDVSKKTKVLTLDAKVTGAWSSLAFDIKSNLAAAIQSSVRSLISEKIQETQRKIKADIERQISSVRSGVDKQVNSVKSKFNKQLKDAKKQVNKVKKDFKKKKKKAEKDAKKNFKNPLKGLKL